MSVGAVHPVPTLAQQVAAVGRELGIEDGLTIVQTVEAANAAVGIASEGHLVDQVRRLVQETGAHVDILAPPLLPVLSVIVVGLLIAAITGLFSWRRCGTMLL